MADADVYEVVRTLLSSALEEAARGERTAQQALDAAREMTRPGAWADVLPWALAEVSSLDPRLSVRAGGDAITLTLRDAGGTATVSVVAFGSAPPAVLVGVDGAVDLRHETVVVSGSGTASWRIDAGGAEPPTGDGRIGVTLRVAAARPVAEVAGARLAVQGDLRLTAELRRAAPVWRLDVAAPRLTAAVSPGALLDVPGLPGPGIAFEPSLRAADGVAPELLLGLR